MYLHVSLVLFYICISIAGTTSLRLRQTLSTVDEELILFSYEKLNEVYRQQLTPTHILNIKKAVDKENSRQLYTVHFEAKPTDCEKECPSYECPVLVYNDPIGHIRALIRNIVCISLVHDTSLKTLIGNDERNINKVPFPLKADSTKTVDVENTDFNEEMKYDSYDEHLYIIFRRLHGKPHRNYNEGGERYKIFQSNLNRIQTYNEQDDGTAIYGVTHLSDLSEEEFTQYYLNERLSSVSTSSHTSSSIYNVQHKYSDNPPESFDWRDLGAVTDVKNQGSCGSCWAFSVTGNIEGVWKVKKGELISLSEQELVDCDKVDEGCNGGYMTTAYNAIMNLSGIESEADYKYLGREQQCQFNKTQVHVYINGSINITQDENEMAKWLAANAPISIGINANMMQFYFRGIAHPRKFLCNPKGINHGVLLVGYGNETKGSKTTPYWIVKNSWGGHWGEKGYYRVYRGDGTCGINTMCSSALID